MYLGVVLVCTFIASKFFFSHLVRELRNIDRQIELAEHNLLQRLKVEAIKDNITQDYNRCKPFLEIQMDDVDAIKAELLKEFEALAYLSGASIVNMSPQSKAEETAMFKKYKAELRMEMTYSQMVDFFYVMEKSKLLVKFEQVSISPKDKEANLLKVEGVASIIVFL